MKSLVWCTILAICLSSASHAQERPSTTLKLNESFRPSIAIVPGHYRAYEATPAHDTVHAPDATDPCAKMFEAMQGNAVGQRLINANGDIETRLDNGWTRIRSLDNPDNTIMRPPGSSEQTCVRSILRANIPSGFQVANLNAPDEVSGGIEWAAYSVLRHIQHIGGDTSVSNCVAKEQELGIATAMGRLHLRLQYLQWLSI